LEKIPDAKTKFHTNDNPIKLNNKESSLVDFWQWAYSDLNQNVTRGMVGQYIVAWILGIDSTPDDAWGSYDLLSHTNKKIEVKTTSFLQAWVQKNKPKPKFRIRKTHFYSRESGYSKEKDFQANIYVLCYFFEKDKQKADVMNLNQWKFWVLPKKKIEELFSTKELLSVDVLESDFTAVSIETLGSEILKY